MKFDLDTVISQIDNEFKHAVSRLSDLLRIPSISTDTKYDEDTQRAAEYMADDLRSISFEASVRETTGHPMVIAHHPGPEGYKGPHLLYYGHYDVQPPDPLELWNTPPFEPTIIDGPHGKRIVARGAVDDKGQLMLFVEAFRAWQATHGTLPAKVSVILEGEEESGSPSLDPFLEKHREELKADVCIVSDTGMWNIETPAITTMLRGLVYIEVALHGPEMDLHSGMFGGAVTNPCNDLCQILGELKDNNGVIQIPGFYDDVAELSNEQKLQWDSLNFDEAGFLKSAGLKTPRGEAGRTTLERVWSRPSCDINGIWGGYTGEGAKTVIASKASAKISCRLVPDQNPEKIFDGLKQFLETRTPPDCRWEIITHGISPAIQVVSDSPYVKAATKGLDSIYSQGTRLIGCGGSIPVVGSIQKILGFESLLVGFGLEDDRVHSPNEKFELTCFEKGIKSHAAMLLQFACIGNDELE